LNAREWPILSRSPLFQRRTRPNRVEQKSPNLSETLAEWDEQAHGISREECEKQLLEGEPRIAVLSHNRAIQFTLLMNNPGDEKLVARRMREILYRGAKGLARHYGITGSTICDGCAAE
jgi:hypothetical protein